MLGHILRSDVETPAFLSLKFALTNNLKGRRGRPQCNLFSTIVKDLVDRKFSLKSETDLSELRHLAFDRTHWCSCSVGGDLLVP